jgi:hypothetical protein
MEDKKIIQTYINNFRRRLSPHLKPGVGMTCDIHPVKESGAILEFSLGPGLASGDQFEVPSATVTSALSSIQQSAFGGHLEGFKFAGTNVLLEKNHRIILIKDDSLSEWDDNAAKIDISKIFLKPSKGNK